MVHYLYDLLLVLYSIKAEYLPLYPVIKLISPLQVFGSEVVP